MDKPLQRDLDDTHVPQQAERLYTRFEVSSEMRVHFAVLRRFNATPTTEENYACKSPCAT